MKIVFQYTPELLQQAHRLHYRHFFPFRGNILLVMGFFSVLSGLFVLYTMTQHAKWMALVLVLFGIALMIFHVFHFRHLGERVYRKLSRYHQPMLIEISEEKIQLWVQGQEVTIHWSEIKKAVSSQDLTLLYPNDHVFFIFPRKLFTPDDYAHFCQLVARHVPSRSH